MFKRITSQLCTVTLGSGLIAAFIVGGDLCVAVAAELPRQAFRDVAREAVEAPQVDEPELSPDGSRLVYTVTRASVAENQVVSELFLQRIAPDNAQAEPAVRIARAANARRAHFYAARWCPDSSCVTYLVPTESGGKGAGLTRYDVGQGRAVPVPIRALGGHSRVPVIGDNYQWAPSGRWVAFIAPLAIVQQARPTIGVRLDEFALARGSGMKIPGPRPKRVVFILDPATGQLEQLSPNTLSVRHFDWAPDSNAIAVAATSDDAKGDEPLSTDLFVIDRATKAVRELVRQPGYDIAPRWSPDGRWISFRTTFGKIRSVPEIAVISALGGEIIRFGDDDLLDVVSGQRAVYWAPDSRSFYHVTASRMSRRLYRADVEERRLVPLAIDDDLGLDSVGVASDGRSIVFVRSARHVPPEVYTRALPNGQNRQLTRISTSFSLGGRVTTQRIQWRGKDGDTLHGLLLTPLLPDEGRINSGVARPLPTLVYVRGGPSMVEASYDHAHPYLLALAAHGYAIFIPNTRGRNGYGRKYNFLNGYRDPLTYARAPYDDVMSGLSFLIEKQIADPGRLGILGHSYGGYVSSFAVTQTHQFRAAVNYEGIYAQLVTSHMSVQPTTGEERFIANIGVENPFKPESQAQLIAVSPSFNLHCVETPMMLLFGETTSTKESSATSLFSGLQRFGIPTELILYDEGHVVSLPTARVDVAVRLADWFDYWVRDLPYPDSELGAKYDAWRKTHVAPAPSTTTACAARTGSH